MISRPSHRVHAGPPLVIVGASVRAAAWSALRAGFSPLCVDQFADSDLAAVAPVIRVGGDPRELIAAAAQYPPAPLMYTGGLENHPDIVARLADERPLWGMGADVLRAIRDPVAVAAALTSARLPALEVLAAETPPPQDGEWLLKPRHSGGGRGIVRWTPDAVASSTLREPHYFQRHLSGEAYSGLFLAREGVGDVRFVGLTEQLIGVTELGARSFAWCGNIGPVSLDVRIEHGLRRIANFLKWKFQLRGLFGLDFVAAADGRFAITEVNPRYPASVELLEFATGMALLRDHAECFTTEELSVSPPAWQPEPGKTLGKGVLFSAQACVWPQPAVKCADSFRRWPQQGDVPEAGTLIPAGAPVLTVYAQGTTTDECRLRILDGARSVRAQSGMA